MYYLVFLPFLIQLIAISIDEFYFHIKRGLPKWERIGHPLDTLTTLFVFFFVWFIPFQSHLWYLFIALSLFSCFFVTKDEFVHKEVCPASEQWLHALLFVNHPILLLTLAYFWPILHGHPLELFPQALKYAPFYKKMLLGQITSSICFMFYQIIYWNFLWQPQKSK